MLVRDLSSSIALTMNEIILVILVTHAGEELIKQYSPHYESKHNGNTGNTCW